MEKVRAKSKSGVIFRIYDDAPQWGGLFTIEYQRSYNAGMFHAWLRDENYKATTNYTECYAHFLAIINS